MHRESLSAAGQRLEVDFENIPLRMPLKEKNNPRYILVLIPAAYYRDFFFHKL